jgi:ABC-2 type transport system permease protein
MISASARLEIGASIRRLRTLVRKELLSYFRDPRMRVILFGPPLMQLLVFSFAVTLEVSNIDIAVLDRDGGSASTDFVEAIAASSFVGKITIVDSEQAMESLIDNRSVLMAVHIPQDFSRRIDAGETGIAQILLDGRRANAAQVAYSYVNAVAQQVGTDLTVAADSALQPLPGLETRNWFNPTLNYRWFIVPSLSGMLALLISVLITALSIARERELGTFDQLLVSPISPGEIIIGKSIPALLIGALLGTIMILAGVFLFRIPFTGSAAMLAFSLPLFILSGVGIGLSISAVSQTQQQAILGAFALIVPIVLTSGFATPVTNMPPWLQVVSMGNPLRHYLVIVQGSFLKALPPADVLNNTWPLMVIALVTLSFATWIVQRKLQ